MARITLSLYLYVTKETVLSIFESWQEWHHANSHQFIGGVMWHQDISHRKAYRGIIKRIDIYPGNQEAYIRISQMYSTQIDQNGQPANNWQLEPGESAQYRRVLLLEEGISDPPALTKMVNGSVYFPYGRAWITLSPKAD